jgi:hypothetical protein
MSMAPPLQLHSSFSLRMHVHFPLGRTIDADGHHYGENRFLGVKRTRSRPYSHCTFSSDLEEICSHIVKERVIGLGNELRFNTQPQDDSENPAFPTRQYLLFVH